jgi:hypothetical protein
MKTEGEARSTGVEQPVHPKRAWESLTCTRVGSFGSIMQGGSMNKGEGGVMMMVGD